MSRPQQRPQTSLGVSNATKQENSHYNITGFLHNDGGPRRPAVRMYLGTSNPTYCQRGDNLNTIITKKLIHFFRISDFYSHFAHHPDYFRIIAVDCNCPVDIVPVLRKIYIAGRISWLTNRGRVFHVEGSHYAAILAELVDKARWVDGNLGRRTNLDNDMRSTPELEQHIKDARATWQTRMQADPMSLLFSLHPAHHSHGQDLSEECTAQEPTHRRTTHRDEPSGFRPRSASPASRQPGDRNYHGEGYRVRTPLAGRSDLQGFHDDSANSSAMTTLSARDTAYDAAAARASNMKVEASNAATATVTLSSISPAGLHDHNSVTANMSDDQTTPYETLKKKYDKLKKSSQKRYADLQASYDTLAAMSDERHAELRSRIEDHMSTTEKRHVDLQAHYEKLATKSDEQAKELEKCKLVLGKHETLLDKLRKTQNWHNQIWKEIRDCLSSMD